MNAMFANLLTEMQRNHKTNREMAELLSMPYAKFFVKLNGQGQFTLLEMEHIADYFGCSIDYLVGRKTERNVKLRA